MREGGRGREGQAKMTYVLLILGQPLIRALGELGKLFQEYFGGLLRLGSKLGDNILLELTTL